MNTEIKFVHTNIVAKDWKRVAQFYIDVFGCKAIYPERDLEGKWIEDVTKIKDVRIKGIHLQLPGFENGPTLEVFEYNKPDIPTKENDVNTIGFGHLAFHVDDIDGVLKKLLENGGTQYGELTSHRIENVGLLHVVYTRDPEGNIVELQKWSK